MSLNIKTSDGLKQLAGTPISIIDDATTATDKVWSSEKTNNEINKATSKTIYATRWVESNAFTKDISSLGLVDYDVIEITYIGAFGGNGVKRTIAYTLNGSLTTVSNVIANEKITFSISSDYKQLTIASTGAAALNTTVLKVEKF